MSEFQNLTLNELLACRDEIDALIVQRRKEAKSNLLSEFREKAESLGLDFEELFPSTGKKRSGTKSIAKYANPEKPSETWTGTGRKPKWVQQQLENGRKLEDLRIR